VQVEVPWAVYMPTAGIGHLGGHRGEEGRGGAWGGGGGRGGVGGGGAGRGQGVLDACGGGVREAVGWGGYCVLVSVVVGGCGGVVYVRAIVGGRLPTFGRI